MDQTCIFGSICDEGSWYSNMSDIRLYLLETLIASLHHVDSCIPAKAVDEPNSLYVAFIRFNMHGSQNIRVHYVHWFSRAGTPCLLDGGSFSLLCHALDAHFFLSVRLDMHPFDKCWQLRRILFVVVPKLLMPTL